MLHRFPWLIPILRGACNYLYNVQHLLLVIFAEYRFVVIAMNETRLDNLTKGTSHIYVGQTKVICVAVCCRQQIHDVAACWYKLCVAVCSRGITVCSMSAVLLCVAAGRRVCAVACSSGWSSGRKLHENTSLLLNWLCRLSSFVTGVVFEIGARPPNGIFTSLGKCIAQTSH